jgi:hypothetical protein
LKGGSDASTRSREWRPRSGCRATVCAGISRCRAVACTVRAEVCQEVRGFEFLIWLACGDTLGKHREDGTSDLRGINAVIAPELVFDSGQELLLLTSSSLATAWTPTTRLAARSAAHFSAYDDTWPVRVTTPFLTETPTWAAFTLGSHFNSSRTSRCSSVSDRVAVAVDGSSVTSGLFLCKCRAGWYRPTGRVGLPPHPLLQGGWQTASGPAAATGEHCERP